MYNTKYSYLNILPYQKVKSYLSKQFRYS